MDNVRVNPQWAKDGACILTWCGPDRRTCFMEGRGVELSASGVVIECAGAIESNTVVHIEGADGLVSGDYLVTHWTRRGMKYDIGFEFRDTAKSETQEPAIPKSEADADADYYDVLQISPKAEAETIHRVFRIMAARFHPDNPETGDAEEFLRLKQAHSVLSDSIRRAEYDAKREAQEPAPMPIFELKDFVIGVKAEANRRLGVLSLLYSRRRTDADHPGVSLLDLENCMSFPREYLTFTMWYLRAKQFVAAADNSDYTLTAAGVDFIEMNASNSEILTRLLNHGSVRCQTTNRPSAPHPPPPSATPLEIPMRQKNLCVSSGSGSLPSE